MWAGLDTRRRVTARVVGDGPGDMAPQLGEVARQLVDPVDGTQVDLSGFVVDHQMCETTFRRREGEERRGGGSGRCGSLREGEEKEEQGEDEKGWIKV